MLHDIQGAVQQMPMFIGKSCSVICYLLLDKQMHICKNTYKVKIGGNQNGDFFLFINRNVMLWKQGGRMHALKKKKFRLIDHCDIRFLGDVTIRACIEIGALRNVLQCYFEKHC